MAPDQPYHGPLNMVESRYASVHRKNQVKQLLAANPELLAKKEAESILVTRDRTTAASNVVHKENNGFGLALSPNKPDLEQTVSNVVARTRQILNLICEAIKQDRSDAANASLKVVENLRHEIDELAEITRQAPGALLEYLKKQAVGPNSVARSKDREAKQGMQQGLAQQHEREPGKETLSASQKALKNEDPDVASKNAELQERIARLNVDFADLKAQTDMTRDQLNKAHKAEEAATTLCSEMGKKMADLTVSEKKLSTENQGIRATVEELTGKLKTAERKAASHEQELQKLKEQLQMKEGEHTKISNQFNALRREHEESQKEADKNKNQMRMLTDKYNNQTGAYARTSLELKAQTNKAKVLEGHNRELQQQKIDLDKQYTQVASLKESIEKEHQLLKTEFEVFKQKGTVTNEEMQQLHTTLKQVKAEKDKLELEYNDLYAKQAELEKTGAALRIAAAENASLRSALKNLQGKPVSVNDSTDVAALEQQMSELKEKLTDAEAKRNEWKQLGTQAMAQFRQMQQKHKQLEGVEDQLQQVLEKNKQLKDQMEALRAGAGDVAYWRNKYHELLAETEN